jgi:predicted transcriptional regulator
VEASRVGVDAFGAFLKALREYEREGEERLTEDLTGLGAPDLSEGVRRIFAMLRESEGPVSAQHLLVQSGLSSDDFSGVMRTLVGAGLVMVTVGTEGAAAELTERGRAATAAE